MFDDYSPYDFELLCQELAEFHFGCSVEITPRTRDGGVDLIINRKGINEVVECKHYPKGKIGRPILQKLVGALHNNNSKKGYIFTSGIFSTDAKNYAKQINSADNGLAIELFDGNDLSNIYTRMTNGRPYGAPVAIAIKTTPSYCFSNTFIEAVLSTRSSFSDNNFKGVLVQRWTSYHPFYIAKYSASGKALILSEKHEHQWRGTIWSDPNSKKLDFGNPPHDFGQWPPTGPLTEVQAETPGQLVDSIRNCSTTKEHFKHFILKNCKKVAKYCGRNNVSYTKELTPQISLINITKIRLMYVPHQTFSLTLPKATFTGVVWDNILKGSFRVDCPQLSECTVCGTATISSNQIICTICNLPAHQWNWFFPDSFKCEACGRLACRNHVGRNANGKIYCQECLPNGKNLDPRWFSASLVLAICSLNMAFGSILWAIYHFESTAFSAFFIISTLLFIITGIIFLHSIKPAIFHKKNLVLDYQIKPYSPK